jgi:hypothetical protein
MNERTAAWRLWRAHLDLLNDLDELGQCKSDMRLSYKNEDFTQIPEGQLNAVVIPIDVAARYHNHAAKRAMALGDLRRAKATLRSVKNQSSALVSQELRADAGDEDIHCAVCLSGFNIYRTWRIEVWSLISRDSLLGARSLAIDHLPHALFDLD